MRGKVALFLFAAVVLVALVVYFDYFSAPPPVTFGSYVRDGVCVQFGNGVSFSNPEVGGQC